jgi:chaperonin cofactor prefoldin
MSDYSETTQLRTRCTILESQINVLQTKNAKLQRRIEQLEKSVPKYKEIPNVGKFPVDYSTLGPDDGDFQL